MKICHIQTYPPGDRPTLNFYCSSWELAPSGIILHDARWQSQNEEPGAEKKKVYHSDVEICGMPFYAEQVDVPAWWGDE